MRPAIFNALKTYANPPALNGNIIGTPNDLNNASWNAKTNIAVTSNNQSAPDGSMAASLCVPNATSSTLHLVSETPAGTTTAVPWLARGRFRRAGYNYAQILVANDGVYSKYAFVIVDVGACHIVNSGGVTYVPQTRIFRLSDQWVFCEMAFVPDANTTHRLDVTVVSTHNGGFNWSGDTVSGVHGWGVEFGPAPN